MTLYEELGGREAIEAVVDDFYDRVLADDSLVDYFEETTMDELREHQAEFLSAVTGGPVEYTGAEMRAAHEHLALTDGDFDAVAGHLEAALRDNGVADEDVTAVLEAVESLRDDVLDR